MTVAAAIAAIAILLVAAGTLVAAAVVAGGRFSLLPAIVLVVAALVITLAVMLAGGGRRGAPALAGLSATAPPGGTWDGRRDVDMLPPAMHGVLANPVLILLLVVVIGAILFTAWAVNGVSASSVLPLILLLVFAAVVAAVVIVANARRPRPAVPSSPPPIQRPMVPAGLSGPVAKNCPRCGSPPTSVDRFGVVTCAHCGARFSVR